MADGEATAEKKRKRRRTAAEMLADERARAAKEHARLEAEAKVRQKRLDDLERKAQEEADAKALAAKKRQDQEAEKAKDRVAARTAEEKRTTDTRKKIIVGALVMRAGLKLPDGRDWLTDLLDMNLVDPGERDLFGLPALPA